MKFNFCLFIPFLLLSLTLSAQQRQATAVYSGNQVRSESAASGVNTTYSGASDATFQYTPAVSTSRSLPVAVERGTGVNEFPSAIVVRPAITQPSKIATPVKTGEKNGAFSFTQAAISENQSDIEPLSRDTAHHGQQQEYGPYIPATKHMTLHAFRHNTLSPDTLYPEIDFFFRDIAYSYGVQIGYYTDLKKCRRDARKFIDIYQIPAFIIIDIKDPPGRYRLIAGHFSSINPAILLRDRLKKDFPMCFVIRYDSRAFIV